MPEAPLRMSKHDPSLWRRRQVCHQARDSRWKEEGSLAAYCTFEAKRRFPHFGINISLLEPGAGHSRSNEPRFFRYGTDAVDLKLGQERAAAGVAAIRSFPSKGAAGAKADSNNQGAGRRPRGQTYDITALRSES
jgi:hypothetical protein